MFLNWWKIISQAPRGGPRAILTKVKAGENGKIFGSVTTKEISQKLKAIGTEMDKHKITLPHPIKQLGMYPVTLKFYKGITVSVKIDVVGQ